MQSLCRLVEPFEGSIVIDDVDVSQICLTTLRSNITIIPQDPIIFSGSIRFNVDPLDMCTDKQIWNAFRAAGFDEFVSTLPEELEFIVTESGSNLSMGQKQLICLVRALLRKTKIVILDEATAYLDVDTDDLVQKTIHKECKDSTVITIAHRLNTVLSSDRIVVLDNGRVVEFDSPKNLLLRKSGTFYSMAVTAGII